MKFYSYTIYIVILLFITGCGAFSNTMAPDTESIKNTQKIAYFSNLRTIKHDYALEIEPGVKATPSPSGEHDAIDVLTNLGSMTDIDIVRSTPIDIERYNAIVDNHSGLVFEDDFSKRFFLKFTGKVSKLGSRSDDRPFRNSYIVDIIRKAKDQGYEVILISDVEPYMKGGKLKVSARSYIFKMDGAIANWSKLLWRGEISYTENQKHNCGIDTVNNINGCHEILNKLARDCALALDKMYTDSKNEH
jgi:hypothetical protein